VTGIDPAWAIDELKQFIKVASDSQLSLLKSEDEVPPLAHVAEQILDRILPAWRHSDDRQKEEKRYDPWGHLREWAGRGVAALERAQELEEKLGEVAPQISAASLHPWVWNGAMSLWASGHYRSAVEDAAKKVNAETQNKLGRRDVSEGALFQEAFSENTPAAGKPRLRRMTPDGSDTYKSMQRGARSLAEGIYAGIRNPLNHEDPTDISEQVALEYLAALSVLARWVDESDLEVAK
jgi:uncharacterized protein (TIGR02391 family)